MSSEREVVSPPSEDIDVNAVVEAVEQQQWYHQHPADIPLWAEKPCWSLDEAVALSLGKDPTFISFQKLEKTGGLLPLEYRRRYDLATRAKIIGKLFEPVRPVYFLSWARTLKLSVPSALETAIEKTGNQIPDWSAQPDAIRGLRQEMLQWGGPASESHQRLVDELELCLKELAQRAQQIESLKKKMEGLDDPHPRKLDSLLKMLIVLAVKGYCYDPSKTRSSTVSDIMNDMDQMGLPVDPKTVRALLKESAAKLPKST